MTNKRAENAVIYCRVSSAKQATDGTGLGSQETRCREYAKYRDYNVLEVFRDEASGGLTKRSGMMAMLAFLRRHRARGCVVIIDDISRLARGIEAHHKLRAAIGSVGGRLESPSIEFGEDSDSQLVENLLASVSQHQRQKNGEQTRNRMRARAMSGYWVFHAPPGYRYQKTQQHGKLLVRDDPAASVIAEALEGYATGRFESQSEVQRFLELSPHYPRDRRGRVHLERVKELLTRPIYAGYVDIPNWGIRLQPGHHEGLIDFTTFQTIQARLNGTAKAPFRKDLNFDFPLRGFVTCGHCGKAMTACWSRGRSAKYPYYLCSTKGCPDYRKSIRREVIEKEFEALLQTLQPSKGLFDLAHEMFRELWNLRLSGAAAQAQSMREELKEVEREVEQFLDRIAAVESASLITTYENRIKTLDERKADLTERISRCGRPVQDFDGTFRTAMSFLANPCILWDSERLEDRRAVLRLVFAEKLPYVRNEGFRTAETTLPFKVLAGLNGSKDEMVPLAGLEPARCCHQQILSLPRLPIPPQGHTGAGRSRRGSEPGPHDRHGRGLGKRPA